VRGQGETLYVAMDDPTNENALQEVSRLANLPTKPMIASASDIRSAIRVYYGESGATSIDVPVPPPKTIAAAGAAVTSAEPAVTVREPRPVAPPTPKPKPEKPKTLPNMAPAPAADRPSGEAAPATIPDLRPQSAPPPAPSVTFRKTQPSGEEPPLTTRSEPPGAPAEREVELPLPRRHIARPPGDDSGTAKRRPPKMVALTLLDGTTLTLPAKKKEEPSDALTARDIASALRAAAHGADASEILGDQARWEPIVAALLSILLRKGLIADWEFVEELRKF
jgi:type IV pilus assembly protein PilB